MTDADFDFFHVRTVRPPLNWVRAIDNPVLSFFFALNVFPIEIPNYFDY